MVLRTLNWKDYTAAQLAKHYNLILEGRKEASAGKQASRAEIKDEELDRAKDD